MSVERRAAAGEGRGGLAAVLCLAALLFSSQAGPVSGLSGLYTPESCAGVGRCPSVSWSVAASLDGNGNFTIMSSANRTGSSNYVSFAFANGTEMEDALFVVDCYEPNGTITVGTSINTKINGTNNNEDSPSAMSRLSNVAAARANGTLTCSFTLDYAIRTLSNGSFYIMLAEGTMNTSQVASPKKNYHSQRFWSASTFSVMLRGSATSTTASSLTTRTSAAVAPQALPALTIACIMSAIKMNLV